MMISTDHGPVIRQENDNDREGIFQLVEKAFLNETYSDHKEHYLVDRLRRSSHFIPELSLIAEFNKKLLGYILLSHAGIKNRDQVHPTLALAPVAVHPDHQNQGTGAALINYAHEKATELGYNSIVLIGHQDYYPKFGYQLAHKFGIRFPFDVPKINSFVIELKKDALKDIKGEVVYAREFFED